MITVSKTELITSVRGLLDELGQNDSGFILSDKDSSELDEIIYLSAIPAARTVMLSAHSKYIDGIDLPVQQFIIENTETGVLRGVIHLPDNFLRLVAFKLSSWDYPVTAVIYEDSIEYHMQANKFTSGTPNKPVCAIVNDSTKSLSLEAYTATSDNDKPTKALYIPNPEWKDDSISVCDRLLHSFINQTAGQTLISFGDANKASIFFNESSKLLE